MTRPSIVGQKGAALVEYLLLSSFMALALISGVSELTSTMELALNRFSASPQSIAIMASGDPSPQVLAGNGDEGGGTEEVMPAGEEDSEVAPLPK